MGVWGMGALAAAWLVSLPPLAPGPAPAGAGAFRVRIDKPALARAVTEALQGAARRLQSPECGAIFGDFKDAAGRVLQANLDALARSGPEYLALVGFYDGQGHGTCLRSRTVAITAPGSRAVWICPQFAVEQRRDRGLAEALLVHEVLHTLGLAENPPSTFEITHRVVARCGR